ncbi:ankyrin repeat, PH and SEC7 domain containing protein secG-like [Hydractinia symbiolongicarpus]|uniref:ankyrin repeat, PH and SEC7 domain containing protein secG-like n=1 Tax=Hydractinia symbiolongicarpus TaxID=13093 RepID=UPI00254DF3FC|nr:ankyrin repeat, PH and SEC7 domain containing protein secG-like [Hydractinia symbiolongicarpus]
MDKEINEWDETLLEIQEDILEHVKSGASKEVLIPLVKSLPHVNYFEVVNKQEEWTPLHWAVATNQKQLCEILIQNGNADVNIMASNVPSGDIKNFAESPFMIACTPIVSFDLFKLLLNNGADVQARGLVSMFSSLLHVVREPIELDLENIVNLDTQYKKLKILLEMNVDVKATSSDGMTCLHWFCPIINDENDREIAAEMFKHLIQGGADVNCRDVWGETPLSHACSNVNPTVIRLLLENGGDINVVGGIVGETFLHALRTMEINFCKDDFKECFRLLINAGVDINSRTFTGDAYLHNLCEKSPNLCAVKMAIESGAEVDVRNCFGHTPLYSCLVFRDEYSYFDEKNKTFCRNNLDEEREKVMEYLISQGGDISARDINEMTALVRAASKGLLDSVTFLLNRGANINSTDKCNRTALHHCVFQLNCFTDIKMVDTLISRGIDVNIKDNFGKTAAYYVNFLNEHNRKKFDLLRDKCDTNHDECMQKYKENLAKQDELKKCLTIPKDGAADAAVKVRENKQLIFELLQTPGVGSVAQLKDNFSIKKRVETLMKRLEKELSRSDSFFTYEALVSGGVSEGTKVGLPDEFDYLFIVHGLLEDFVCDETETEPGFIRLKNNRIIDIGQSQVMTRVPTAEDTSNQTSLDGIADADACFRTSGYFDTAKFIRYFHSQVFKIMQKPCFWDDLDLYWMPLSYKLQGDFEREINVGANLYVELQCPTEEIGELNISIDVVPVVRFPDTFWPKDSVDKSVSLIRSNQDNFCGVLMKAAGSKTKEATQIRLSTSLIERNILQSSTPSLKEAFVLLKTLKNISSLQLSKTSKFKVRTIFNTYDFKNAAIHYAAQYHEIKNRDATRTEVKRSEVCLRDTQTESSEAIAKHVRNITAFVNRESFFFPNAQISRQKVTVRDKSEDQEVILSPRCCLAFLSNQPFDFVTMYYILQTVTYSTAKKGY